MKKSTKISAIAVLAAVSGVLVYKNRKKIKKQFQLIYDGFMESTGINYEKIKKALSIKSIRNNELVKNLSKLILEISIDPQKINYTKIAVIINKWVSLIETQLKAAHDKLLKFSIYEAIGQDKIKTKVDDIIKEIDSFKQKFKTIKKEKIENNIDTISYNLRLAIKEQMHGKKKIAKVVKPSKISSKKSLTKHEAKK